MDLDDLYGLSETQILLYCDEHDVSIEDLIKQLRKPGSIVVPLPCEQKVTVPKKRSTKQPVRRRRKKQLSQNPKSTKPPKWIIDTLRKSKITQKQFKRVCEYYELDRCRNFDDIWFAATKLGHLDTLKMLHKGGLVDNPHETNSKGLCAEEIAESNGYTKIVDWLQKIGTVTVDVGGYDEFEVNQYYSSTDSDSD